MSATMQQGLASLLIRRTEEGRAKARRCIEAWQNAIAVVQRAERMAECKINLSIEQTQGVQQTAAEVDMANYVLAMHLANKAAAKRDTVIATAIGVLQEEIKHCDGELSGAQHALQTAIRERDGVVTVAKKENDAGIQKIYEETTGSVRDFQLGNGGDVLFRLLSVAICVAFFVYGDFIVHDFFTRLVLVPVIWVGLLIVMGIVLPDTVTWLRKARAKAKQRSRTAVAETTFKKAVEAAEKRLQKLRPVLEERRSQAEAHRKKAENALRWLTSQA